MIALGTATYAFGFVNFNMVNHLAEGGVSGITLIFHALFKINPAYTNLTQHPLVYPRGENFLVNGA